MNYSKQKSCLLKIMSPQTKTQVAEEQKIVDKRFTCKHEVILF